MDRDEFMELVYETFAEEPDNVLANGIIEAADAYVEYEKTQLSKEDTTSDLISKFIDGLEEIFADLRERHVDDSVCGLCEYDGAYIGQSGDWCNECPGFDRDDCFKLSDETRKEWTEEIVKALPTAQPEPKWIPVNERLPEVHESGNFVSGIYMQSNPVLVYGTCEYEDNAQFHVVTYCDDLDGNTYWSTELDAITVSGVLAWMPLPEPYKPNNE